MLPILVIAPPDRSWPASTYNSTRPSPSHTQSTVGQNGRLRPKAKQVNQTKAAIAAIARSISKKKFISAMRAMPLRCQLPIRHGLTPLSRWLSIAPIAPKFSKTLSALSHLCDEYSSGATYHLTGIQIPHQGTFGISWCRSLQTKEFDHSILAVYISFPLMDGLRPTCPAS